MCNKNNSAGLSFDEVIAKWMSLPWNIQQRLLYARSYWLFVNNNEQAKWAILWELGKTIPVNSLEMVWIEVLLDWMIKPQSLSRL